MCIYINVSGLGPVKVNITCGDQGIFIRGGGVQTRRQENSLDSGLFFVCLFFLFCVVLNLLTEGFQWFISERVYMIFQGVQLFPGTWGVQVLISIETLI